MRKTLILFGLILMASSAAMAQGETPKAEIAGNYTYIRFSGGANCNGGGGSIAANLNSWFGVVGDFSGCKVTGDNAFAYLFGPKIAYRSSGRATPYFQVLFGGMRLSGGGFSSNAFAMTVGGGLDVKVSPQVAIRLAQGEYLMTRFGGVRQNNFRLESGIVFRFGSK